MYIGGKPMSLKLTACVNILTQAVYVTEPLILTNFQRQVSNINCQYNFFLKNSNASHHITIHYYKKNFYKAFPKWAVRRLGRLPASVIHGRVASLATASVNA